ncbi:MAG: ABC transporter ATP-binding protein/permease [Defluviitaleaceae bacterium]|nr:ABC transporter ATP-binding protein/permease [Defluviitaleaceae bacterium]
MLHILPYWRRYQKQILTALVFLGLGVVGDLLLPLIVSEIINRGVLTGDAGLVLRLGGLMLLVTVLNAGCTVVRCVISSKVSQQFGADLRLDLFSRINRFSFATLSKGDTAGTITRLTNDTAQLVTFTNSLMRVFVRAPALLIGAFIMTIILNPRLAVILLVVVPVIAILMYLGMKLGFPLFSKMQQALDKNNAVIREYLSGVRVVKAYTTFDQEVERFGDTNTGLAAVSTTAQRTIGIFFPIVSFTVNMGLVLTLWFARGWVENSQMQVGEIVAFLNYMMQISMALGLIFAVYQMFIRARASAERIGEMLEEELGEDFEGETLVAKKPNNFGIEFENVVFKYPNGSTTSGATNVSDQREDVLKGVSFVLPAGETLGIIGSTGAGKTTLVQLIPKFYAPDRGRILVGGIDIAEIGEEALRRDIAYVAQQNTLFQGTIAENIRMGKPDATQEELENAAKAACAHEFIAAFPEGYEAVIGQKGVNLSGGQKQRVGIARALIRNAPILILDDCTSAVDVETEAAIMEAIHDRPTCLLITQRISSVINLKYVLVMDDGQVAGFGSPARLMKECKVYQEIYHSQLI